MRRKSIIALAAILASLRVSSIHCSAQEPIHIGFEGPPPQPPHTAHLIQLYEEAGMVFTRIDGTVGFVRVGANPLPGQPDNGTTFLQAPLGTSLAFRFSIGSPFSLMSVDLAEYSTVLPDAVTVHFIGYRLDGSIVTQDFTTDGIIDGTGPGVDFQTFQFGPEFSNLSRVEIPTFGWSLDNLVVVPEPGTWGLLITGFIVGAIVFRKGRRGRAT